MNGKEEELGTRRRFSEIELNALGDYLPEARRSLADQSIPRTYLTIAFVAGLIAQSVAYLLRPVAGAHVIGLAVDLLYSLGWALWTGVVVVFFVQVLPEAKRREVLEALKAYEDLQRERSETR